MQPKSLRAVEAEARQAKAMMEMPFTPEEINQAVSNVLRYSSGTDWSCVERAMEVFRSGYSGSVV